MAPLTHPSITEDGWFREISDQWPGQAMTLKVNKVLHVEQSKVQDVLVFESETYGNVLVLDGAIQATERDEFSYQEMIAHIPLASHPNPKNVLVIGGGDGGVLREILKHPSVESATLVDIDEAVPRVSKLYLKDMAKGFDDPKVTLHIGDGFQWLKDNKGSYDVIVTDSSDPVGPANSLFQMPYFELLKAALAPGGTICTQGECMWIHIPLITELQENTKKIFPKVEYAWTSIPTYPSGTIGFLVATLDEKRDLSTPLRSVKPTRYWSPEIHRASFVKPEFIRKAIVDAASSSKSTKSASPKKVLLLGSGFVAQPAAEYVLRRPENSLTIGCRTLKTAQALASELSREAQAISIDASNGDALDKVIKEHDLVISLVPYTNHATVIKSAIRNKKHVVTTSYVSEAMQELHEDAKKAGIIVMNEIGLDPGIDHIYAVKMIDEIHKEGGKIDTFLSYCGGLPAPSSADNPLGYKFSWSPRGVLLAARNAAKFYEGGEIRTIPGEQLMSSAKPYYISPAFAFVAYPNRDSSGFRESYQIPEAKTVIRGTLRYQGCPEFILALVKMGFLNDEPVSALEAGKQNVAWKDVTAQAIKAKSSSESDLTARINELVQFPNADEQSRIMSGLRWLGLLSSEPAETRGNVLDTLCATLEKKMQYEKGEKDMVMLEHKFVVIKKDGSKEIRRATLLDYGAPFYTNSGPSSMARLVGVPCGIAVQLVLDGVIKTPGVLAPYSRQLNDPIMAELEKEGITMVEKVESA